MMATWLAAALLVMLALHPRPSGAELYVWSDHDGVVHYTGEASAIPREYRDSARQVGHPGPRTPDPTAPADALVLSYRGGEPLLTRARLNGTVLILLVDTGADRTVITPGALARAGLASSGGRSVRVIGATGTAVAREVTLPLLDLGVARLGPLVVVAHDPGVPGVDGLIGRDVLEFFAVTIDPAQGRATLVPLLR